MATSSLLNARPAWLALLALSGAASAPSPAVGQQRALDARDYPVELKIWADPWVAEQNRPRRKAPGHDAREPEDPPPVSRRAVHRTRPPGEWPEQLPDDSEQDQGRPGA